VVPRWRAPGDDIFLAKFNASGTHLWSKRFGNASFQSGDSVAVDPQGNVFTTGYLMGSADFGGGTLTSAGATDVYLAKFSPTGAHLWSKRFGDSAGQAGSDVTVTSDGNVAVTGVFAGTLGFGGPPLGSAGGSDVFVAKFDPNGNHLWSKG
jgi:hypothetical protein